jgi:2-keto-4-pentenoate hydratase/2-oxohepta-3-ene-1,7-dioic acid hydratase in catechol pathway
LPSLRGKGKSFDGGNVQGPWMETPDEIDDPYKLKMEIRINGKMRSQAPPTECCSRSRKSLHMSPKTKH